MMASGMVHTQQQQQQQHQLQQQHQQQISSNTGINFKDAFWVSHSTLFQTSSFF